MVDGLIPCALRRKASNGYNTDEHTATALTAQMSAACTGAA